MSLLERLEKDKFIQIFGFGPTLKKWTPPFFFGLPSQNVVGGEYSLKVLVPSSYAQTHLLSDKSDTCSTSAAWSYRQQDLEEKDDFLT